MAHLQVGRKQVSGDHIPLIIKQSINVDVWGPWERNGGEYPVRSKREDRVRIDKGKEDTRANTRRYKLTAVNYGRSVIEIYWGPDRVDFIEVYVVPDHKDVLWAAWYSEVVPGVMKALRADAKTNAARFEDKAGFFIAHGYSEQSPGVIGVPSAHGNRLFNMHALVTRNEMGKITGIEPGQEEPGVTMPMILQNEGPNAATRDMKRSATFEYDSVERGVTHYIKLLQKRYPPAFQVLTASGSQFASFAGTLERMKYAKEENYGAKLTARSTTAVNGARKWVKFQILFLRDELTKTSGDVELAELHAEIDLLEEAERQLKNFR